MKKIFLLFLILINIILYSYSFIGVRLFPPLGVYLIVPVAFTVIIVLFYKSRVKILNNFIFICNLIIYIYSYANYDLIEPSGMIIIFPIIFSFFLILYQLFYTFKVYKARSFVRLFVLINTVIILPLLYLIFANLTVIFFIQTINQFFLNFYDFYKINQA